MTASLPLSYNKFDYGLRPSKQVERKVMIEALLRLSQDVSDVILSDYTYLGFGSPYYIDFILFHKYLHIDRMICVEGSPIPRRMEFNKPYDFIDLKLKWFSQVIPSLDRDSKYILWLDFDTTLSDDHLRDIEAATTVLAPGSMMFVTLDAEVRIPPDLDRVEWSDERKQREMVNAYQDSFGRRLGRKITTGDIARGSIPRLFAEIVRNTLQEEAKARSLSYSQVLNVKYADGAQMVSFGGVLADSDLKEAIEESEAQDLWFVHDGPEPLTISVPPLTVREKLWLEQNLEEDDLAFELEPFMAENFKLLYKYYPSYIETLI